MQSQDDGVFVMDAEKGTALIERLPGVEGVIVGANRSRLRLVGFTRPAATEPAAVTRGTAFEFGDDAVRLVWPW